MNWNLQPLKLKIMIDNLRVYFGDREEIENFVLGKNNHKCSFDNEIKSLTYPLKYSIGNLIIVVWENCAYMENSIHKFYNKSTSGSATNFNDLSFYKLTTALDMVVNELDGYNFNNTKISNLEFGFNLKTSKPAAEIICKNILLHKYKTARVHEDEKKFSLKRFKSGNYEFKIYDKALESDLKYNLIRIEIIFKAKELKRLDIINICDLYEPKKIKKLFSDFLHKFNHLVIVDDRFNNDLNVSEVASLGNILEPSYWKQNFGCNKTKTRKYRKLKEYVVKKKLNNTSNYLREKLQQKFNEIFIDCESISL